MPDFDTRCETLNEWLQQLMQVRMHSVVTADKSTGLHKVSFDPCTVQATHRGARGGTTLAGYGFAPTSWMRSLWGHVQAYSEH